MQDRYLYVRPHLLIQYATLPLSSSDYFLHPFLTVVRRFYFFGKKEDGDTKYALWSNGKEVKLQKYVKEENYGKKNGKKNGKKKSEEKESDQNDPNIQWRIVKPQK